MTVEVMVLGWAGVLAFVQLLLFAVPANREVGSAYLAGPRDEGVRLSPRTARLQRAFLNHIEGLVLFTAAVAVVTFADRSSHLTQLAALIYLAARIVYVPLYWAGIRWWRSAVWGIGALATLFILVRPLLP
jgi:uncharacterized MAPEG superfamily protein